MRTLTFIAILFGSILSVSADQLPPMLEMHIGRLAKGPLTDHKEWPDALFQGQKVRVTDPIISRLEHIESLKHIPKKLLKGYKIGTTIEHEGWFYTSVDPMNSKSDRPLWILVAASKIGDSNLYFNSVW